ncbi:hypothetical protein K435DRAFT_670569, partial [Dendrothele bispora CBS 962.96]
AEYLEEQISILENRIRELENPTVQGSGMVLQNPYIGQDAPTLGMLHLSRIQHIEIPPQLREQLLSAFLSYASELGFFLDPTRFYASATPGSSTAPPPSPALLQTVILLATHIYSTDSITSDMKAELLSQAVNSTSQALSSNHPDKVLQTIQAHVLLAQYFFLNGRKLEGRYNVTMAVSLVLSTRLHRIRSLEEMERRSFTYATNTDTSLPPPRDAREEMERIDAFWVVLSLNSCWATSEGTTSSLTYWKSQFRVDTPWPGRQIPLASDATSTSTIQLFLACGADAGYSILALHAKACILFEQSHELSSRFSPSLSSQSTQKWVEICTSLRTLARRFQSELPRIETAPSPAVSRQLLVIHTLTYVTKIRILSLMSWDPSGEATRRAALEAVYLVKKVDLHETTFIDPIMGVSLPQQIWIIDTDTYLLMADALDDDWTNTYARSVSIYGNNDVFRYAGATGIT